MYVCISGILYLFASEASQYPTLTEWQGYCEPSYHLIHDLKYTNPIHQYSLQHIRTWSIYVLMGQLSLENFLSNLSRSYGAPCELVFCIARWLLWATTYVIISDTTCNPPIPKKNVSYQLLNVVTHVSIYVVANVQIQLMYTLADRPANVYIS